MGMFSASCNAGDRFSLEGNFQTVHPKNLFNDNAGQQFVISSLQTDVKFPVYFQLFHNMRHMTCAVDLSTYAAAFFMAHFRFQTISFHHFYSLF